MTTTEKFAALHNVATDTERKAMLGYLYAGDAATFKKLVRLLRKKYGI